MITDAFLDAVFTGLNALLSLVPSFTFPTPGTGYATELHLVFAIKQIFPIELSVSLFVAYLTMHLLLLGWDLLVFVYHQFWGGD